jgi:hypothetical protein
MEMAHCMFRSKKTKLSFWREAMVCATDIINKTLVHAVTSITPYEKWYGNKPSILHFIIFGFSAWVHAPNEGQNTLASQDSCYNLVGYNETL